jgi:hypothetical protein
MRRAGDEALRVDKLESSRTPLPSRTEYSLRTHHDDLFEPEQIGLSI